MKDTRDFCLISDALENIPNLTLNEQYTFSLAPLKISFNEKKLERSLGTLKQFAEQYSSLKRVKLPSTYHLGHRLFNKDPQL